MQQKIIISFLMLLLYTFGVSAAPDDSWGNVFKFQTKMAERGNVSAQYILGEMYEDGRGVEQNHLKALEWYKKAQQNGHNKAAAKITKLKEQLANPKPKKQASKKITNPAVSKSKKKASVAKQKSSKKLKPKKEIETTKKTTKKKVVKASSAPVIKEKPKRPNASPNDLSRGIGTHMDTKEDEDPFE